MKTKNRKNFIFILAILISSLYITSPNIYANVWCRSEKCQQAAEAERLASEKASNASSAAATLEGEVERLNQEIAMYEARISANEAIAEDLKVQIEINKAKLELQQQALANMLVNIHFEGKIDTIMVLASSNSISDFAEKKSRIDTAKTQINLSAQTIKTLKEDLEKQKTEVDRIIADQQIQRKAVENTKNQQEQLVATYRNNAAAYSAEAAAARKIKEQEIANAIAEANSSGTIGNGTNTYPKRGNCPRDNLAYTYTGGYVCQCVSYTGWKVKERYGISITTWGNAKDWYSSAKNLGYRVDRVPEAGSVAVSTAGFYGHVMWVESINSNGTINLSEYNNPYSSASHLPGDFGYRIGVSTSGLWFIHFH